jgi:hypothetical protein
VFQKKARAPSHTNIHVNQNHQPPNQHAGMKQALRYANNEKLLNYPDWKERVHKACIRACEGDQTRTGIINALFIPVVLAAHVIAASEPMPVFCAFKLFALAGLSLRALPTARR